jgi:hypothetical protein
MPGSAVRLSQAKRAARQPPEDRSVAAVAKFFANLDGRGAIFT